MINKKSQHFNKRLFERYQLTITKEEKKKLIKDIQLKKFKITRKQSRQFQEYLVPFKEQNVIVIYDNLNKILITALPKRNLC